MEADTIDKAWIGEQDVCIQRVPEGRHGRRARPSTVQPDITQLPIDTGNSRSLSVPRARKKRRLALAIRDLEPEAPPVVRLRRGRDGGPTTVEKGEWRDPDDIRPNAAKTGKTVRGYHVPGLRRLQRVSSKITDAHVLAADYVAMTWDVAKHGFQAERDGLPVNQVVYLPKLDFSGAAHAQVRALNEFRRIWGKLSRQAQRMATVVILSNFSVAGWCGCEERRTGVRPNEKEELGKLVFLLDHLVHYLDADIDEAREKGRMRA